MYTFSLNGKVLVEQPNGIRSTAECDFRAAVLEQMLLQNRLDTIIDLSVDGPTLVPFGTLVSANLVLLRVLKHGARVLAKFTHADGAAQAIPLDPFLLLITSTAPIMSITLERSPGILTSVETLLGEVQA